MVFIQRGVDTLPRGCKGDTWHCSCKRCKNHVLHWRPGSRSVWQTRMGQAIEPAAGRANSHPTAELQDDGIKLWWRCDSRPPSELELVQRAAAGRTRSTPAPRWWLHGGSTSNRSHEIL